MSEFVTFGETSAVFMPEETGLIRYQNKFNIKCSGSESNTAIAIRKLGHSSAWMGRIGDDEIGQFILKMIRSEGVSTDFVTVDPLRKTPIMITQNISDYDSDESVFYYRETSAANYYSHSDINESAIKKAKILHITGITPILSSGNRETVYHAIYIALKNNVKVSFDPNIRLKLWNYDYTGLMKELCKFSDITLLTLDEAEQIYETRNIEKLQEIILRDDDKKIAAVKNGREGAWIIDSDEILKIKPYPCSYIDHLGAGDAFNAGFLCGILEERTLDTCGKMGAICGAAATQISGAYEGCLNRRQLDKILFES